MPNTCCDLHLHTYFSNGEASPGELLRYAAEIGLKTVSITDHENVSAAREAAFVAGELGLDLIPGVELTSRWDERPSADSQDPFPEVHVLGYFIDSQDPDFLRFTEAALEDLRARITDCCRRLSEDGYPVTVYDVLDENPRYPGAMQLIAALRRKGYAGSRQDAFTLFARHWRSVRLCAHTTAHVIEAIHAAGGVAVLAHPVSVRCGDGLLSREHVARLVALGLDGLEVIHPRMNREARLHFTRLAESFGLLVTGGSDEHGCGEYFTRIGSKLVSYQMVCNLRRRAGQD